jgi:hypothetical protein
MPKYSRNVSIPGHNADALYERVSADIEKFLSKTPIGKYDINRDAPGKKVAFKSQLASAMLVCTDNTIQIDVDLSLFAAPFRSKLDEGLNKWLAKAFNVQV